MFNYEGLFPIITNLVFIAPAVRAFLWGRIFRAFHSALVLFSSGSYHVCKAYAWACLFDFQMHKDFDYIVAVLFIPLDAIYFVYFDQATSYLEWWAVLLSVVVVALITTGFASGFVAHAILAGVVMGGLCVYWLIFYLRNKRFPNYDWRELTLALVLSLFGVALFLIQDFNPDGYWYIHGMWHLFVGLGRFFVIGVKPPVPRWMNMASRIEYHVTGGWSNDNQPDDKRLEEGELPSARVRLVKGFRDTLVHKGKTAQRQ